MDPITGWAFLVAGAAAGSLLVGLVFRARTTAVIEAAVADGRATLQGDLAATAERARSLEVEMLRLREQAEQLRTSGEDWRRALDVSSRDAALHADRAARMPQLEAEVSRLQLQLHLDEEEMRRLAQTHARKDDLVASLVRQVQAAETLAGSLQARLDAAVGALHEGTRRREHLQREADRVPLLERQLGDALRRAGRLHPPQATATPAERPTERRGIEPQLHHVGRQLAELRLWVERNAAQQGERMERLMYAVEQKDPIRRRVRPGRLLPPPSGGRAGEGGRRRRGG